MATSKSIRELSKSLFSLGGLAVLALGLAVAVALVQEPQLLESFAKSIPPGLACRAVPPGTYNTSISGDATISWKLQCNGTVREGEVTLEKKVSLGKVNLPRQIRKGNKFAAEKTLADICNPVSIQGDLKKLCDVCQLIDCKQVKFSVELGVSGIECQKNFYKVSGQGKGKIFGSTSVPYQQCTLTGAGEGNFTATLRKGNAIILEEGEEE